MDKKLNGNTEKIKENSIKLLQLYGLLIPFVFIGIFTFFSIGLDLYKLSGKTIYLPRLDAPLILLFFLFLPIINIFIIDCIHLLKFCGIKLNKNPKLMLFSILFMKFLNLISIVSLFSFIILNILLLIKVYSHWINLNIIKEMGRGLI